MGAWESGFGMILQLYFNFFGGVIAMTTVFGILLQAGLKKFLGGFIADTRLHMHL